VIESGIAVTEGSGGTNLGTASRNYADTAALVGSFNSTERSAYGSNNYKESALRQWIQSDKSGGAWFTKRTVFDLPPSYAGTDGFLKGIDADFVAALVPVDIIAAQNAVYEVDGTMGGSYTMKDKVFIPSMTEITGAQNNNINEGSLFPFYDGAAYADRIKYQVSNPETAQSYWLRSTNTLSTFNMRIITTLGYVNYLHAYTGNGVAAVFTIG
jgi:hypothetical protein